MELTKLSKLKTNPRNPRTITDAQFERLKDSLLVFPKMLILRPLATDGNGIVLGGNMRLRALKDIAKMTAEQIAERLQGMKTYNQKSEEEQTALVEYWRNWLTRKDVPTTHESTLTDAEKDEFVMTDNASFGSWDFDAIANEWDAELVEEWGVDVWQDVMAEDEENDNNYSRKIEEDDFDPEEVHETKVKCGDIWILGKHRLMCGDSTDADAVAKLMNGERADLWITDPPYNVDYNAKNEYLNKVGKGGAVQVDIENDKMSDADFDQFLRNAFGAAQSVMKEGASYYVWTAQGHALTDISKALDAIGMSFRQQLIWVKNNFVIGRSDYQLKHEPCFYGWKAGAAHHWHSDRSQTTVLNFDKPLKSDLHPTMKPVPLFGYQVGNSTKEGDIVIDTFGGSGTTMIACEQLGRKCFMMELDPHYCTVIIARWEKLTGEKARKAG